MSNEDGERLLSNELGRGVDVGESGAVGVDEEGKGGGANDFVT